MLKREKDPMGQAILDFATTGKAGRLRVLSSQFDEDSIDVPYLFRSFDEMPALEQRALSEASGRVLDIGAGAGCHSLVLQERGLDVTSVDISPLSCEAMKLRGLRDVRCLDVLREDVCADGGADGDAGGGADGCAGYDTILMLMNGTGIAGTLDALPQMLHTVAGFLAPGGRILIDSSDLSYLYDDDSFDDAEPYIGEVDYRMIYKKVRGEAFPWLYCDYARLEAAASFAGLHCRLLQQGDHYDYLAEVTQK